MNRWINMNLPYGPIFDYAAGYADNEVDSFTKRDLSKAGVLIEVQEETGKMQYLIGHINENRGVCDDCTMFDTDTIVVRYMIVWPAIGIE